MNVQSVQWSGGKKKQYRGDNSLLPSHVEDALLVLGSDGLGRLMSRGFRPSRASLTRRGPAAFLSPTGRSNKLQLEYESMDLHEPERLVRQ